MAARNRKAEFEYTRNFIDAWNQIPSATIEEVC
jgi:hypothetical protein